MAIWLQYLFVALFIVFIIAALIAWYRYEYPRATIDSILSVFKKKEWWQDRYKRIDKEIELEKEKQRIKTKSKRG